MPKKITGEKRKRGASSFSGVFMTDRLVRAKEIKKPRNHMGIITRETPEGADDFFEQLMDKSPFAELSGKVRKSRAKDDILYIFEPLEIPEALQANPIFMEWVTDMAEVCKTFCNVIGTDAISFWLGTNRGCVRYHIDAVPFRALVTYKGTGTEWLPNEAADRDAFFKLKDNDEIVKDPSKIQFVKQWNVTVFRGGAEGVMHRSPDAARDGSTILMRLDRLDPELEKGYFELVDPESSDAESEVAPD